LGSTVDATDSYSLSSHGTQQATRGVQGHDVNGDFVVILFTASDDGSDQFTSSDTFAASWVTGGLEPESGNETTTQLDQGTEAYHQTLRGHDGADGFAIDDYRQDANGSESKVGSQSGSRQQQRTLADGVST